MSRTHNTKNEELAMSKENDYGFGGFTEWLLAQTFKSETLGGLLYDLQEAIADVQQLADAAGHEVTLGSLGFGSDDSSAIGQLEGMVTATGNEALACSFNNDDGQEYARRLSNIIEVLRNIREQFLEDHIRLKP